MSGSGDHLPNQLIPDRLRKELAAILAPMKAYTPQGADLHVNAPLTVFETRIPCPIRRVTAHMATAVSRNTCASFREEGMAKATLPVPMGFSAVGLYSTPCAFLTRPVRAATRIAGETIPVKQVDFRPESAVLGDYWAFETIGKSRIRQEQPGAFNTASRPHQLNQLQAVSRTGLHRLRQLPLQRTAIPPHRFSSDKRRYLREQLAKKTGTHPGNVTLQVVYDRLDMSLFASIDKDDRGHLLCYPKTDASSLKKAKAGQGAYLVFGTRVDTGDTLRALIPPMEKRHDLD